MDLEHVHSVAISAAFKGAHVLRTHLGKISQINKKGDIDLVTEADLESEKQIISAIQRAYPDHSILAEESGSNKTNSELRWIIDPLDGTTNYAHQLPIFTISIAFAAKDEILTGIVLNPISAELFSAIKGCGAQLNGRPIKVSSTEKVSQSLLVTGFPYNVKELFDMIMARYSRCLWAARGIRRLGSAALDLCYVACGRFDGFWEQGLKPWDTAAGALIATEAGACITDFANQPFMIESKHILATNGRIHKEMLTILRLKDGE
jgi:myo-inositol-1(or 4)-monophosphatase